MLISDEYRKLNELLHKNQKYGSRVRTAIYQDIQKIMSELGCSSLLDYGCGKGEMAKHLPAHCYDPCVPEFARRPDSKFDLVACCDVLEHIEPDHLNEVLADIRDFADKAVYLVISTRPASKTLADGRNAHLIVQPGDWWIEALTQNFTFWQLTITNTDISSITVLGTKDGSR
jgi:2-polyprenyl-3-methyl-5-hydroxy-6-metoxy-1,4-benzoquinol methylase